VARAAIGKAKREFKRASVAEEAEAIYEAFPRKSGKLKALEAITTALRTSDMSAHGLLVATKRYADAVSRWPKDRHQFIPMPATWFNQGRYMDDPATWTEGFIAGRPPQPEECEDLPEPARYEDWFRAHYEQEPKRWQTLSHDSQRYYLRMMRQLGILTPGNKTFVGHAALAEMVGQAFKVDE
jgi:hypothetical protein